MKELVPRALEMQRYYRALMEEARGPIWRFPYWYTNAAGKCRVLCDGDLDAAERSKLAHPYQLFMHPDVVFLLFGDSGHPYGAFDCSRHGQIEYPHQWGVFYGFRQFKYGPPWQVIDAVKSGQCSRIMSIAGWRQIQWHANVNRVSFAVDCKGLKYYFDEAGEQYCPEI